MIVTTLCEWVAVCWSALYGFNWVQLMLLERHVIERRCIPKAEIEPRSKWDSDVWVVKPSDFAPNDQSMKRRNWCRKHTHTASSNGIAHLEELKRGFSVSLHEAQMYLSAVQNVPTWLFVLRTSIEPNDIAGLAGMNLWTEIPSIHAHTHTCGMIYVVKTCFSLEFVIVIVIL